ncbi:MAG TPA: hypothetical protein VH595_13595 [Verrucomicrobiae bacterium]|jgi:hypothetical protein|nr:hypothetical protein [Verrucomicrobiae bacterium]
MFSTNFGQTWVTNLTPFSSFAGGPMACSQDGTHWAADIDGELCTAYWPPSLTVQLCGANLAVSWPAPSSGLVLQENSDISTTNWVNVPVLPAVSNYQNRVFIPATNATAYFRLATVPF